MSSQGSLFLDWIRPLLPRVVHHVEVLAAATADVGDPRVALVDSGIHVPAVEYVLCGGGAVQHPDVALLRRVVLGEYLEGIVAKVSGKMAGCAQEALKLLP